MDCVPTGPRDGVEGTGSNSVCGSSLLGELTGTYSCQSSFWVSGQWPPIPIWLQRIVADCSHRATSTVSLELTFFEVSNWDACRVEIPRAAPWCAYGKFNKAWCQQSLVRSCRPRSDELPEKFGLVACFVAFLAAFTCNSTLNSGPLSYKVRAPSRDLNIFT